ncbi:hypothetical protein WA026_018718 [Henosepilachna vigintioctopunctata]|uniref:MORN repeat-containing protein 4 n=1 Tax=Henosepilachna vigintioctopunctata TaxID=420089 RepID=A0AAW1TWT3_9CUCU
MTAVAATGGYRYKDGTHYVGTWDKEGKPHGEGYILFPDDIRYSGSFKDGKFSGLGVLVFPDGARYEGDFLKGWFHGYGTFWRSDTMRFEGEFRGGHIHGFGRMTFNDGTSGFPKHEGFFKDRRILEQKKCPEIVDLAQKISFMARQKYFKDLYDE